MKLGSLTWIFSVVTVLVAASLIGLNYWHASKCGTESSHSIDEMNSYIESLKRKLLQAETQVESSFPNI
jgi:hypothetical protein